MQCMTLMNNNLIISNRTIEMILSQSIHAKKENLHMTIIDS